MHFCARCIGFPRTYGHEVSSPCYPDENTQMRIKDENFASLIFTNLLPPEKLDTALTFSVYDCL